MKLTDCHNIDDFRALAKRRLPWPVFDYIDGAADDEVTRRRNRDAFDRCDLIPRVLAGVFVGALDGDGVRAFVDADELTRAFAHAFAAGDAAAHGFMPDVEHLGGKAVFFQLLRHR